MKKNELNRIVKLIFLKHGLSKNHSKISTDALINAELVGAYGHGLSRLKMYCDRISKNVINPKPKIKIKKISQSISHIDANNSIVLWLQILELKQLLNMRKKLVLEWLLLKIVVIMDYQVITLNKL